MARASACGFVIARTKPRRLKPAPLKSVTNRARFYFPYVRNRCRLGALVPRPPALRAQIRGMCEALASLIFPAPCRICTRMLDTGNRIPFCHECIAALRQSLAPSRFANNAAGRSYRRLSRKEFRFLDATFAAAACTPLIWRAALVPTRPGCPAPSCC